MAGVKHVGRTTIAGSSQRPSMRAGPNVVVSIVFDISRFAGHSGQVTRHSKLRPASDAVLGDAGSDRAALRHLHSVTCSPRTHPNGIVILAFPADPLAARRPTKYVFGSRPSRLERRTATRARVCPPSTFSRTSRRSLRSRCLPCSLVRAERRLMSFSTSSHPSSESRPSPRSH